MVRIGDVTDHDPYNLGVQQILTSLGHLETLDLRSNCLEDGLEGLRAEDCGGRLLETRFSGRSKNEVVQLCKR